ncbi:unnamed protein product [Trypanosoma congolense IL3000]|uniref:WGS project CAEQ00000000 data, annotated contig 137 n=1 Tax=Trypanosoma congolense (strain IL3000) TaxID=1068625 RepID=F9W5U4_TRYCI|nr:unnamed protein product [Trypanosoma congolense IL3000]
MKNGKGIRWREMVVTCANNSHCLPPAEALARRLCGVSLFSSGIGEGSVSVKAKGLRCLHELVLELSIGDVCCFCSLHEGESAESVVPFRVIFIISLPPYSSLSSFSTMWSFLQTIMLSCLNVYSCPFFFVVQLEQVHRVLPFWKSVGNMHTFSPLPPSHT